MMLRLRVLLTAALLLAGPLLSHAQVYRPGFVPGAPIGLRFNLGSVLWSPLNLGSSLVAWWDASDTAHMTFNGSNVASWTDKVGGVTISNATAANQPVYATGQQNGLALLSQQSAATPYGLFTTTFALAQPNTIIAFFNPKSVSAFAALFDGSQTNSNREVFYTARPDQANKAMIYAGTNQASVLLTVNQPYVGVGIFNGASSSQSFNGTQGATVSVGSFGITSGLVIGGSLGQVANQGFIGYYGDVYIVSNAVSTSVQQKFEGFVSWKYGTQGSLPAGHPYKSRAPYVSDP